MSLSLLYVVILRVPRVESRSLFLNEPTGLLQAVILRVCEFFDSVSMSIFQIPLPVQGEG